MKKIQNIISHANSKIFLLNIFLLVSLAFFFLQPSYVNATDYPPDCSVCSSGCGNTVSSGPSYPPPTVPSNLSFSCLEDGNQVNLSWQPSSYSKSDSFIERAFTRLFKEPVFINPVAHAGGGTPPPPPPRAAITYSYQINSQGTVSVGGNTTAGPIAITPGVEYQFRVLTCAESCAWSGYKPFKCNAPSPVVTLNANPSSVSYGNSSTLTWTVANATSCTASGDWSGSKSVSGGSQSTGALTATSTYNISCTGSGGTATASTTVKVSIPPPTVTLNAAPSKVIYGDSSTLSWSVTNATSCSAFDGWSGSKNSTGGSEIVEGLMADTSYRLVCSGLGGTAQAQTAVVVETGTGAYIEPNKTVFRKDDEVILDYGVGTSNPSTCTLKRGSVVVLSSVSSAGTYTTTAGTGEATYTLDCPGNQATATIKTLPEFQET